MRTRQHAPWIKFAPANCRPACSPLPAGAGMPGPEARQAELAQEVYMVISGKAQLKDPAAQAVVRYMETQLLQEGQDGAMALACDSDSVTR